MKPNLSIVFGTDEVSVDLPGGDADWPADEARRWLDQQFIERECEPLRASGKLLTADRLLAIADAIGRVGFEQDPALLLSFARAALAATARSVVRIDVDARTVSF
jgi:hypothetical protein